MKRALVVLALLLPVRSVHAQGCPSADLSHDGRVSGADISILLGVWGTDGGTTGADLNGSGSVTGSDLAVILDEWGQECPPTALVPPWATLIEAAPDPAVVRDPGLRARIAATGFAWRVRHNFTQAELLLIPPGSFDMGCTAGTVQSGCGTTTSPVHAVTITRPFYIGRYECSQREWQTVMGYNRSRHQDSDDHLIHPVELVNGSEIRYFATRAGVRLPTEAEWEYACRAGTSSAYPNGSNDESSVDSIGVVGQPLPGGKTLRVGTRQANAFGLHDMIGNVDEQVADWFGPYPQTSQVDPTGPTTGTQFVVRGGGYPATAIQATSYRRFQRAPDSAAQYHGFRIAVDASIAWPRVPSWGMLIEAYPDPAVVFDQQVRDLIRASGHAWRVRDSQTGIEFVLVPPGSFSMGCVASSQVPCASDELPKHVVTLSRPFYVARTEVTQAQWLAVTGSNPASFQGAGDSPERPVESVDFPAVQNFMVLSGVRLLTEAEWEYAYRARTSAAFHGTSAAPGGTSSDGEASQLAWCNANAAGETRPVAQLHANGFGIYDMGGNVWEWVNDFYGPFENVSQTNPTGPVSGNFRVIRGGAWNVTPGMCRASERWYAAPAIKGFNLGLRVARDP